jgi:hypothetical protein
MFHLFFQTMLQVCLSECCICFTPMLQIFYLDVVYICNDFKCFQVFLQVFQMHVSSVSSVFRCLFQVLHLDVSNWVLHLPSRLLLPRLVVFSSRRRLGIRYDVVARAHRGSFWTRDTCGRRPLPSSRCWWRSNGAGPHGARETKCRRGVQTWTDVCPDVRTLTLSFFILLASAPPCIVAGNENHLEPS